MDNIAGQQNRLSDIRKSVLIVCRDASTYRLFEPILSKASSITSRVVLDIEAAPFQLETERPRAVVLPLSFADSNGAKEFIFVKEIRTSGYRGSIALLADTFAREYLLETVRSGANDLLIRGDALDLQTEIENLIVRNAARQQGKPKPILTVPLTESGFLKSLGLAHEDIELLDLFYDGRFPPYAVLAKQSGLSVRKVQNAMNRMRRALRTNTRGQFVNVITLCKFLG